MKRRHHLAAWPALAVVLMDQLSKWIVAGNVGLYERIPVVEGFFNLIHIRNRGMAFGLLNRPDTGIWIHLLVVAGMCAVVVLIYWLFTRDEEDVKFTLGLSFILGGAIGNLIDRFRHGEVVDFLDFHVGAYHWPAFNLADSAITVGAALIAFGLISGKSQD